MSLSPEALATIAHLARLQLQTGQSVLSLQSDLSRIMKMIDQINAINTEGVEPLANPLENSQILRADQVTELDQSQVFQALAPKVSAGLYLVPKVID